MVKVLCLEMGQNVLVYHSLSPAPVIPLPLSFLAFASASY